MKYLIFPLIAVLAGCAVQKDLMPTGGSRSDGSVKLSYETHNFEKPIIDEAKSLKTATDRCRAWGYSGAEKFGGQTRACNMPSFGGCDQWLVTVEYQCTGNPPK